MLLAIFSAKYPQIFRLSVLGSANALQQGLKALIFFRIVLLAGRVRVEIVCI